MALVKDRHDLWGNTRVLHGTHTMPASYAAGGDPSDPGFDTIENVHIEGNVDGRKYAYDFPNKKIMAFEATGHTHTENTAATYTQNATTVAGGAGALVQTPAATNLSTVVLKVTFWGR